MPTKNKRRKKYKRITKPLNIDPNVYEVLVGMAIANHRLIKVELELIIMAEDEQRKLNLQSQPSPG